MKIKRETLRWALRICLIVALIVLSVAIIATPALSAFGRWLAFQKSDSRSADVIIVLQGGLPDRAHEAGVLFAEKKAERILLVREARRPSYRELDAFGIHLPDDTDVNRQILLKLGVPPGAIDEVPGEARSTWEEALAFAHYARQQRIKSAVIVTCRFHTRRAYLNVERACAGQEITLHIVPSRYCPQDPVNWWRGRDQAKEVYLEVAKLVAYHLGFR